ncbi:MAG: helix-turn-helix transcriptional regulator [Chloroflexia bacterium]|nr:helix-turn-helix transcriptional regulator [Chloroflexia bacterium]
MDHVHIIWRPLIVVPKKLKLNQEQFAEKLGISVKELASYEGDIAHPPLNVAIKMADALNISLDFLACRIDEPVEAKFLKRIVDIQNMDKSHHDTIVEVIDLFIRDDKRMKIERENR